MQIPGNQRTFQRQRWRVPLLALPVLAMLSLGGAAQAAAFDEKVKAPMVRGQADLQSMAQPMTARYLEVRDTAPELLVKDAAFARQRFDLNWQVKRSIDERKPLEALASQGLVSRGDGSYRIELADHPQWDELHITMAAMLSRANFDATAPALIVRGFRPEDIEVLKEYAAGKKPEALAAEETLPLSLGFSRAVRKYDKLKRPVPDSVITSYIYQREWVTSEASRLWVEGLLNRLDAQRARIVMSTFLEHRPVTVWAPSDLSVEIKAMLDQVRQPGFEALATAEAKGVAR
jgi:hypothetical protein